MKNRHLKLTAALAICLIGLLWTCAHAQVQSKVQYVYVRACQSCGKVSELLDALPETISIQGPSGVVESEICVERLDLGQDLARVQQLFEAYSVPEEARIAPIVFLGERYLSGADAILENLETYLEEGAGLVENAASEADIVVPDGEAADLSALSWLGTLGAGFVGGLNPCALSMLLLFLATIMSAKERPGRYAALFLISKFVIYVLIGLVLFNIMRLWDGMNMNRIVRWLLTILGGGFAAMNIADAVHIRRDEIGKVRNQLPAGIRGFLHRKIKAVLNGRFLLFAVVILGAVVAMGEFLCAGQVYLATLLMAVRLESESLRQKLMLLLYCGAFLIPSIAISALVCAGKRHMAVSNWLYEHMFATKLLTAAVIVLFIAVSWLI